MRITTVRSLRAGVVALSVVGMIVAVPLSAFGTATKTFTGTVDASGIKWRAHTFDVTATGTIDASLDWDYASANLNLFLYDPSGSLVAQASSATAKPETITYEATVTGTWKLGVKAVSGKAAYTLSVTYPGTPPPTSIATYQKTFGFNGPAGNYAYGGDWDPSTNTILWGDFWNYRVKRYTIDGQKCTVALCGSPFVVTTVKPKGQLGGITAPYDIETDMFDTDASGRASFWVADQGSSRIVEFSYTGQWLQTIGVGGGGSDASHPGHSYAQGCGNGQTIIPTHMYVDPSTGRLFVADPRCRNVYVYTHSGSYLFEFDWGPWKTATGIYTPIPRGIAEGKDWDGDGKGDIYVVEHNTRAVAVFDKSGTYLGKFPRQEDMNDPRGLDIDPVTGYVVVVSAYRNSVFQFNPDGTLRMKWNEMDGVGSSMGNGHFDSIRFPAVDGDGNIYTGDTWGFRDPDPTTGSTWFGYRIYKFDRNANPMSWATGSEPPPDGGFSQNNGVALTGDSLFVVDTFEQRVQKLDTTSACPGQGNCPAWRLQFGSREPAGLQSKGFGYPRALTYGDGYVWVGDNNNAVLAWTTDGQFVHRFGSQGPAVGQFKGGVQGIRVPGDGNIYTTDLANCRLQVFDEATALSQSTPSPIAYMGSCGSGANQMLAPRGIAVDGNTVYVAETGTSRISVWNVTARTSTTMRPTCDGVAIKQPWGITWDPSKTWLYIGDSGNQRVVRVTPNGSTCQVVSTGADTPDGFKAPDYLEFGSDGLLYVSDNSRHVYAFTIGS